MIEKSVLLPCSQVEAFALFTQRISDWWPAERRHTGDPRSTMTLSPDRFAELAGDGRVIELGRVRAWEPPLRLLLDFYPGTDPKHPTEVEVRFVVEGDGTRVVVQHGPTERSQELWNLRCGAFERSWDLVLPALAAAVVAP